MRLCLPNVLYGCSLVTLPWIGVGVIHFFFGKDVGSGLQPSWLFLALAMLVALGSKKSLSSYSFNEIIKSTYSRPLIVLVSGSLLFVCLSGFGIIISPSLEPLASAWWRWGRQIFQLIIMLAFLVWAANWTTGKDRWGFTLDLLFLGVGIQILYGAFQEFNFFNPQVWFTYFEQFFTSNPSILSGSERLYVGNALQEIPRLRGTMCEPLYLGNFLLMVWPFLLVWRRPVILRIFMAIGILLLLILTWSRGAWLGALGQLFLFVLVWVKIHTGGSQSVVPNNQGIKRKLTISILMVSIMLIFAKYLTQGIIHQRLMASFNNQDWSNLTRLYSMKAAWLAFLDSPITGIGWGQFAFHFPLLVDPMGLQSQFSWPVVNNFPLQILCETGLLGGMFFMGLVVWFLTKIWHTIDIRRGGRFLYPMVLPAAMSVAGVWIQLMTFSQYNLPHIWVSVGLLMASLFALPAADQSTEKRLKHD